MRYNILLIEDNTEMAENIQSILELANYAVISANDGKTGVDMALENLPDLILCDIMMPGLDGYGVLHILRNNPETESIPFIFLTAKAEKQDFRMGMNLGADDYITKPFDGIDLLKVVEMRIKRSAHLKTKLAKGPGDIATFFSNTKELKEFEKLSGNRPVRSFRRKNILFMEGQSPNELYHIEKGHVKTYKVNFDGKELITGMHGPGDFLGYMALLENKPYNESAESIDAVQVSIIPKQDFITLIYANKDVARKFIDLLSNNVEEMENRLMDVAYQSVRQRVAGELLKLAEQLPSDSIDKLITVSRRDISNIVGTATESLNRTLADFKDEKLVEITDHGLRIINKPKLEKVLRM